MKFKIYLSGLTFFAIVLATASFANPKPEAETSTLATVVQKYRQAKLSTLAVDKTVTSEILEKKSVYQGKIYISAGKFRWETDQPEKSLLVYDGSHLWNVQYPAKEFEEANLQVTKSKLSDKAKGQNILSSLFGKQPLGKIFSIKKDETSSSKDQTVYSLEPKDDTLEIKEIRLTTVSKLISKVQYKDEVGNLTELIFTKTSLSGKPSPGLFKYSPPKGAKVTEI